MGVTARRFGRPQRAGALVQDHVAVILNHEKGSWMPCGARAPKGTLSSIHDEVTVCLHGGNAATAVGKIRTPISLIATVPIGNQIAVRLEGKVKGGVLADKPPPPGHRFAREKAIRNLGEYGFGLQLLRR